MCDKCSGLVCVCSKSAGIWVSYYRPGDDDDVVDVSLATICFAKV